MPKKKELMVFGNYGEEEIRKAVEIHQKVLSKKKEIKDLICEILQGKDFTKKRNRRIVKMFAKLDDTCDFEDFAMIADVLRCLLMDSNKDLLILTKIIECYIFRFHGCALGILTSQITYSIIFLYGGRKERTRGMSESEMQESIIENFENCFPAFEYIGREVTVSGGRIDILAKDKTSGRPVIIELKIGKSNGSLQLLDYARFYSNPILIAVSEKRPKRIVEGIQYVLYGDLF